MDVEEGKDFKDYINPQSLEKITGCKIEPFAAGIGPGEPIQFERQGYFCVDRVDSAPGRLVFNRTVSLRDTWARIQKQQARKK